MQITRRGWIGAAGAAALAGPALAQTRAAARAAAIPAPQSQTRIIAPGRGTNYDAALEALGAYARDELAAYGLPGMTLSVTDADGFTALITVGLANVEHGLPVGHETLFQIGSISKSFLAITTLALAQQGRLDVDAPIARYAPEIPWPAAPITVSQVMSHSAGLPDGAAIFPRVAGGRLWTGFPAGSKFSYSNTGFDLLGAVVERVTGLTHQEAIRRHVRAPLGLEDMAADIRQANRARFAVGYMPWDSDAAELPRAPMQFAPWDEEDTPAGSIGATGAQMAIYLRALLALGRGRGGGLLSDAMARRFVAPVIASDADFGPGSKYAQGVAIQPVDGQPCLHHTGGMIAFSSSFHADPAAGVAAFASVNARQGGYRPRATTAYAIRLMRAARAGAPLPAAPDPLAAFAVKNPARLAGRYVAPGGETVTLSVAGGAVTLASVEGSGALMTYGGGLASPMARFSAHAFEPVRGAGGAVTGLWWRETLFGRDAARPPTPVPPGLRALAGIYLNRDPWIGSAAILARGDSLVLEGGGRLIDRGPWWSLDKDPGGVERFTFDGHIGGRATRLNASGADLIRISA
jgi:CubicO group peptidase (beta-lactamase class C family)